MPDARPPVEHQHVHKWEELDGSVGWRTFTHAHPRPDTAAEPNAARWHSHKNGKHAHPHGHDEYPDEQGPFSSTHFFPRG